MGTSSSFSGPTDAPGLLPTWAITGDGNNTQADEDQDVPEQPTLTSPAKPRYWWSAKTVMTKYVRSGGSVNSLRVAGSRYVRAKGGAKKAASLAVSGKKVSSQFGGFLSTVLRSGIEEALDEIGLHHVIGKSSDYVLALLVDTLAPSGSTKEEASARQATIEALEFLYETVIGDSGDLGRLERMDQETVEKAIARSVSGYIYSRWLDELGLRIEKGAINEAEAVKLESEVKEYVDACITLELHGKSVVEIDWKGIEGHQIIDQVYYDAYALLEAGS